MARIRHTKNELKAQRDALERYLRYLPTLQLKKQQLQLVVRRVESEAEGLREKIEQALRAAQPWVDLFSQEFDPEKYLTIERVVIEEGNVAGVVIPVFKSVVFRKEVPDLFVTPSWYDDALELLESLMELQIRVLVLEEQLRRLREELRITTQRVNLFEKVKIPECRENIRIIRIFLGDQQTAEIARAKVAKRKSTEKVRSA
ncbi:MAG: V-type ATP synthase subunit D [Verrucomicrobia bacterium]|nr:MAG: V-type ATP synthase subunit D [Verrucomicrobiota bacterium]